MEKFKTVNAFCNAVKKGKVVNWSNSNYVVKIDYTSDFCDRYYIYCNATKLRLNTVIWEYNNRLELSPEFVLSEYFVK